MEIFYGWIIENFKEEMWLFLDINHNCNQMKENIDIFKILLNNVNIDLNIPNVMNFSF